MYRNGNGKLDTTGANSIVFTVESWNFSEVDSLSGVGWKCALEK